MLVINRNIFPMFKSHTHIYKFGYGASGLLEVVQFRNSVRLSLSHVPCDLHNNLISQCFNTVRLQILKMFKFLLAVCCIEYRYPIDCYISTTTLRQYELHQQKTIAKIWLDQIIGDAELGKQ